MPVLILTSAALSEFTRAASGPIPVWLPASVASASELSRLRSAGFDVTQLLYDVRTQEDLDRVLDTVAEHHPSEPLEVIPNNWQPFGHTA